MLQSDLVQMHYEQRIAQQQLLQANHHQTHTQSDIHVLCDIWLIKKQFMSLILAALETNTYSWSLTLSCQRQDWLFAMSGKGADFMQSRCLAQCAVSPSAYVDSSLYSCTMYTCKDFD